MSVSLGEFEQIALLAILRLGDDAYGVTIREEIFRCIRREVAPGALYTCLGRMEDKRLIQSRTGNPTPERGGRAKRYLTVTSSGRAALVDAQRAYQKLLLGLDLLERNAGGANG
jgi:PadR family transcriptional regulator PadR